MGVMVGVPVGVGAGMGADPQAVRRARAMVKKRMVRGFMVYLLLRTTEALLHYGKVLTA
jgi:hypothetical protein